MQLLGEMM